jgi:DNA-binding GntR family transcriptional regulator
VTFRQYASVLPLSQKLYSQLAYDKIVEFLLSASIPEDSALSERNLSSILGFGRTPIREAVRDLVREGVLESHPTRGTIVRPLSITDLQDLYEIRGAIEGLGAAMAAERGRVDELEPFALAFEKALDNAGEADLAKVHEQGVEFHSEIIRLSGNKRLLELYRPFRLRPRILFGIVPSKTADRVWTSLKEHQAVLNAIVRRDGEAARRLICEHLQNGLDFRIGLLLNRFPSG